MCLFCCLFFCRVIFTGSVVVIPDIFALASPGERAESRREGPQQKNASGQEGVKGLRALGVRDLSYRLAFIANSVQVIECMTSYTLYISKSNCFDDMNLFGRVNHCSLIICRV